MFRNLRFYRVTSPWPESEEALSEILSSNAFTTCGSFSERRGGWEALGHNDDDPMCRRLNGADRLQLRTQSGVLPAAAMRAEREARRVRTSTVNLRLDEGEKTGVKFVEARKISFAYPDAPEFIRDFSVLITRGDKEGLIGPNGVC